MTTIAFDGKTLAGDSQTQSAYIQRYAAGKIRKAHNRVWGCAGDAADCEQFDSWMRANMLSASPKLHDEGGFVALVVERGKCWRFETSEFVRMPAGVPAATGSGCEIAMSAMLAGADARQAVKIAIKLDPHSGGPVRAIDIEPDPCPKTLSRSPIRSARSSRKKSRKPFATPTPKRKKTKATGSMGKKSRKKRSGLAST